MLLLHYVHGKTHAVPLRDGWDSRLSELSSAPSVGICMRIGVVVRVSIDARNGGEGATGRLVLFPVLLLTVP